MPSVYNKLEPLMLLSSLGTGVRRPVVAVPSDSGLELGFPNYLVWYLGFWNP
jgi:hypothetical protein